MWGILGWDAGGPGAVTESENSSVARGDQAGKSPCRMQGKRHVKAPFGKPNGASGMRP